MMLRQLRTILPDWLFGTFCLMIPALYNSFPLVTADSGGYVSNAYTLYLPIDRPVGYSVLIRLGSLGVSLWGVVLVQALLVSGLMLIIARHALQSAYRRRLFAAIMLTMGVATTAGWTIGQLTPDVFTSVLLLSLIILICVPCSRGAQWLLCFLMTGCMLMHNSNLLIGLLLSLLMVAYGWNKKERLKKTGLTLLAVSAVAWLSHSAMNAVAGRGFRPSSASHVFIMSRMVENGIAGAYLDEHCPTEPSSLCAYKDHLPDRQWTFMWDSSGPLYKAGGWQATEADYNRIIRGTLTSPRYLGMHFVKNAHATLRQLPLIYAGDELAALGPGTSPYISIDKYFHDELNEYATTAQQHNDLELEHWNIVIVLFSLVVCLIMLVWPGHDAGAASLRRMFAFSAAFLLINAAVTATLATVVGRYEARVFWVLPFLATLHLVRKVGRDA